MILTQVQKIQAEMQTMIENMRNGQGTSSGINNEDVPSVEVGEGMSRHRMYYWGG